jgi:O-methyltransferase
MLKTLRRVAKKVPPFRGLAARISELQATVEELRAKGQAAVTGWGPLSYCHDGQVAYGKNMEFLHEEAFVRAYNEGLKAVRSVKQPPVHIEWRVHIGCWAAQHAVRLPGDFVECGVCMGFLSSCVCSYIDFNSTNKFFYLFDTFQGIPQEQMAASERKHGMAMNEAAYWECYDITRQNFAHYPRVRLVRGKVPDTLNSVSIDKVCYLSLDMNIAAPELAALTFFWDKLVTGALVVLDDYGWQTHHQQKSALDKFVESKGAKIATLPTGQGLLIKP